MVLNEKDQSAVDLAIYMLNTYPLAKEEAHQFSEEDRYLDPRVMLRAALDYAPTDAGKVNMAKMIVESGDNDCKGFNTRLENHAKQIFWNLLVPWKTKAERPETSTPPSNEAAPVSGEERWPDIQYKALKRFNYVCRLSGMGDLRRLKDKSTLQSPAPRYNGWLRFAHIIPYFLGETSETNSNVQTEHKKRAWTMLGLFAGSDICKVLSGEQIDSLENVIAMESNHHTAFGEMRLWFTEPEGENGNGVYVVHHVSGGRRELTWEEGNPLYPNAKAASDRVDFHSSDPTLYPDVSPLYLRIHSAVAEMLLVTGAGNAVDEIMHEWEEFISLSEDGTHAELLAARLSLIQAF